MTEGNGLDEETDIAPSQSDSPGRPTGIHTLAPELLDAIFHWSIPLEPYPLPCTAPLNVSHVCRLWRNIALSSSNLWGGICLPVSSTPAELRRSSTLVDLWFSRMRSPSTPIDVTIVQPYEPGMPGWDEELESISKKLVDRRANWRHVRIASSSAEGLHFSFSLNNMCKLQSLVLDIMSPSSKQCPVIDISASPDQRLLGLKSLDLQPYGNYAIVPTWHECLLLLSRAPLLECASVYVAAHSGPLVHVADSPLRMPQCFC